MQKSQRKKTVKLLGFTLDQHLTFLAHIDSAVMKARNSLGMLRKAAPNLPKDMRKMTYIGIARAHMEYCNMVFIGAAETHLKKLDLVQRMAARIISKAKRDAHAAPLLESLGLECLNLRRRNRVRKQLKNIRSQSCHPALNNIIQETNPLDTRTMIGKRRFRIHAQHLDNSEC